VLSETYIVEGGRGATGREDPPMRPVTLVFGIGLALATTHGALAQNTLLLGRGQPPRQTTAPLHGSPHYMPRQSGQFMAPAQAQAYRMPNGRYTVVTPRPLMGQ
jgi:hypothetical protein